MSDVATDVLAILREIHLTTLMTPPKSPRVHCCDYCGSLELVGRACQVCQARRWATGWVA